MLSFVFFLKWIKRKTSLPGVLSNILTITFFVMPFVKCCLNSLLSALVQLFTKLKMKCTRNMPMVFMFLQSQISALHSSLFRIQSSMLFRMWYFYVGFRSLPQKKLHYLPFALLSCHFLFPVYYNTISEIWEISCKVKNSIAKSAIEQSAPRVGLEPTTARLTAACSTNWAIEDY